MTMFARLKRRPIEIILLLVTFNLVGTGLVAIMALQGSPQILGFSIAAAVAACLAIIMIASQVLKPLRALVREVDEISADYSQDSSTSHRKGGDIAALADSIGALKAQIQLSNRQEETSALQKLEEVLRQLANGDATQQLQISFPQRLEGLRVQFNRIVSALSANIGLSAGNARSLREQARSSQSDLSVIAARLDASMASAGKSISAIDVLQKAARMRHGDARRLARHGEEARQRTVALTESIGQLSEAMTAARKCSDDLDTLSHRLGDLTVRAETAANSNALVAGRSQGFGQDCLSLARDMMQVCRQNALNLDRQQRLVNRVRHETKFLAMDLEQVHEPAAKLSTSVDLELQRLSFLHAATQEGESVMLRASAIAGATETAVVRMMSDAAAIESRLSLFRVAAPESLGRAPANGPNLRCIT